VFDELRGIIRCQSTGTRVILDEAVEKVKSYQRAIQELEERTQRLKASNTHLFPEWQHEDASLVGNPQILESSVPLVVLTLTGCLIEASHTFVALIAACRNTRGLVEKNVAPTLLLSTRSGNGVGAGCTTATPIASTAVTVSSLLPQRDVASYSAAVDRLIRKEWLTADCIRTVITQNGVRREVSVRSLMWLETSAQSPPFIKCIMVTGNRDPVDFSTYANPTHNCPPSGPPSPQHYVQLSSVAVV